MKWTHQSWPMSEFDRCLCFFRIIIILIWFGVQCAQFNAFDYDYRILLVVTCLCKIKTVYPSLYQIQHTHTHTWLENNERQMTWHKNKNERKNTHCAHMIIATPTTATPAKKTRISYMNRILYLHIAKIGLHVCLSLFTYLTWLFRRKKNVNNGFHRNCSIPSAFMLRFIKIAALLLFSFSAISFTAY